MKTFRLNDGNELPAIGFGTYPMTGDEAVSAITHAIGTGYRLLDSAISYGNEREVGEAIRQAGVDRRDIQITTKIPGRFHDAEAASSAVEQSLENFGVEQLDLVLIHWPNPRVGKYVEAWEALVDAQQRGLIRSIGVSNFKADHLERVIDATGVTPAVNQIELHPYFPQADMLAYHAKHGIVTEAWSPLAKNPELLAEPVIRQAAETHGVTPGQVVLRWHIQRGVLPLPKSQNPKRQAENFDIFGFELQPDEVSAISGLEREDGRRFGGDPDTYEEL